MKVANYTNLRETKREGLFICNAGFEARSRVIHDNITLVGKSMIALFHIKDSFSNNAIAFREMNKFHQVQYNEIDLYYDRPVDTFTEMKKFVLSYLNEYKNVYVDITSFTHEHLLMLTSLILEYKTDETVIEILYNKAVNYSADSDEFENKWLTRGVRSIRSIIGYPGYFDPMKKNHLIIIVGFEVERIKKVIEEFEYDLITLCIGSKHASINEELYEINKKCLNEICEARTDLRIKELSLVDFDETRNILESYINCTSEKYNHVILPLNNKISTLATGVLAYSNKTVQLSYTTADEYNVDNYSTPSEEILIGILK